MDRLEHSHPEGFSTLIRAYEYATDTDHPELDFAVEVDRLMNLGLTECDLRWLICKRFAVHGVEITVPSQTKRKFHVDDSLIFSEKSCLALTQQGFEYLKSSLETAAQPAICPDDSNGSVSCGSKTNDHDQILLSVRQEDHDSENGTMAEIPTWCPERRELKLNGTLIKRYKVPSPNQELILSVFEEEGWPIRIDDPLPSSDGIVRKRRLQDTIKSLNRNQKSVLIKFRGDGSGEGVLWELIRCAGSSAN